MLNERKRPGHFNGLKVGTFANGLIILLLISAFFSCKKQDGEPNKIIFTATNLSSLAFSSSPATYDLTYSLPKGYTKSGTIDYTSYIQAAVNKYPNVTFPSFPLLINDKGIVIGSNKIVNFIPGSQLILKATSNSNYDVLKISHSTNITINNPTIVGDALIHIGSSGEWGNGIGIYSSSNITIYHPNVTYCWGDGIYVSTTAGTTTNTNIKIIGGNVTNNRRDGVSVTSVIGLEMDSLLANYSSGNSPQCGINLEPQSSTDELQKVTINYARTGYNGGNGIQVSLSNLYGGVNKIISVTINGHMDKKSNVGFKTSAYITKRVGKETITGTLNIINPYWRANALSPIIESIYEPNIKILIPSPSIQDINGDQLSDAAVLADMTDIHHMLSGSNYKITF